MSIKNRYLIALFSIICIGLVMPKEITLEKIEDLLMNNNL